MFNSNEVTPNLRGRKRGRPSSRGKSVTKGDERVAWSDEEAVSFLKARYVHNSGRFRATDVLSGVALSKV
jgi:hypothetical protein